MPRIKIIDQLIKKKEELFLLSEQAQEEVDTKRDWMSNKSDSWQESEQASKWEEYLDNAEEIINEIQNIE